MSLMRVASGTVATTSIARFVKQRCYMTDNNDLDFEESDIEEFFPTEDKDEEDTNIPEEVEDEDSSEDGA